ncbi:MAG: apolipoprotein N-acyltransferase [Planctomycetota bacterium]
MNSNDGKIDLRERQQRVASSNDETQSRWHHPVRWHLAMPWLAATLLWSSQPPFAAWPLAFVALVPLIRMLEQTEFTRLGWWMVWLAGTTYWAISLQGIRHAHPLMAICWLALAGYLGLYWSVFVIAGRRLIQRGVPPFLVAPIAWVGCECLRGYLLTGISAAMLGHTLVDVPVLIQIADLFGSYGVSWVIVSVSAAIAALLSMINRRSGQRVKQVVASALCAAVCLGGSILYGMRALQVEPDVGSTSFLLLQRDEQTEYGQSPEREIEIFRNYSLQAIEKVQWLHRVAPEVRVDAVVWPESMFTPGEQFQGVWNVIDPDLSVPPPVEGEPVWTVDEYRSFAEGYQNYFQQTVRGIQSRMTHPDDQAAPHLLMGCGVVRHAQRMHQHSSIVHADASGTVTDWYAKTHLVLFGEYFPIVSSIPGLSEMLPSTGLTPGTRPVVMQVGQSKVLPNVCIETAVERVVINQLRAIDRTEGAADVPDVVVTVTNDTWFDRTSVVDHHLRCAQLVAVAARRPILSAANGGPTAWIDSSGRIVKQLKYGANDCLIATPALDSRQSLYVSIGDTPALALAMIVTLAIADALWQTLRKRSDHKPHRAGEPGSEATPDRQAPSG